ELRGVPAEPSQRLPRSRRLSLRAGYPTRAPRKWHRRQAALLGVCALGLARRLPKDDFPRRAGRLAMEAVHIPHALKPENGQAEIEADSQGPPAGSSVTVEPHGRIRECMTGAALAGLVGLDAMLAENVDGVVDTGIKASQALRLHGVASAFSGNPVAC